MYRFYIEQEQKTGNRIEILNEDINHIRNVLRMREGEELILCDKAGTDYLCRLSDLSQKTLFADVIGESASETELPVRVVLFQGLPKKDKMELIIQKAIELGVAEIVPVITERTIVKTDEGKEEKKLSRWQAIAESAAKQSERGIIPKIHRILSFQEALAYQKTFDYNVILYENARGMQATKEALSELTGMGSVSIFVGPEGGFSEKEVNLSVGAGAKSLSLGKRILRTETAGLAMLSMVMLTLECAQFEHAQNLSVLK